MFTGYRLNHPILYNFLTHFRCENKGRKNRKQRKSKRKRREKSQEPKKRKKEKKEKNKREREALTKKLIREKTTISPTDFNYKGTQPNITRDRQYVYKNVIFSHDAI